MNSRRSKQVRRAAILTVVALIGVFAIARLVGSDGLPALQEKRAAIQAVREENRLLREEVEATRKWVARLKNDPEARKQLIRERLHLTEEGVIDFKTPAEKSPASEPAR
jgi:cell division protein FtsB